MKLASAMSIASGAADAVDDLAAQLAATGYGSPDFVALHFSVAWPSSEVHAAASAAFKNTALHGGSSCLGVVTDRGLAITDGRGMGALAIWDPEGAYGTGMAPQGAHPRAAARIATKAALHAADRDGEAPDLVWLTAAPGAEEQVLAGIRDVLGVEAPVVGGSAADNDVSGNWAQFDHSGVRNDAVVVSVLFSTRPIARAYQSGYAPTATHGRATRVNGRTVYEIDGEPAADVYARWTGGAVAMPSDGSTSILASSTFHPLGRETGHVAGVPFHLLAHPAVAEARGGITLFADVALDEELWLMEGSADSLVARAGRVAAESRFGLAPAGSEQADGPSGALVVYCGGCMLAVQERMREVEHGIRDALGGAPFLGVFTFGEQGAPLGSEARHGNLMISCSAFG